MPRLSEDEIISTFFAPLAGEGAFRLQDDAALIGFEPDQELVINTDTIVAGVHFFENDTPQSIAAKALRVNLSDLAAKGAKPLGYVLAMSLPETMTEPWLSEFAKQLGEDQKTYAIDLLGGDTTRTPGPLSITITAFGTVPKGCMVKRAGAKLGDLVMVTGTIGDAALGCMLLKRKNAVLAKDHMVFLHNRYRFPQPRTGFCSVLHQHASAAMDISDGFIGDVKKLCNASQVHAQIRLEDVPYSKAALALIEGNDKMLDVALTGGDDYEILFTLPPDKLSLVTQGASQSDIRLTVVGNVKSGAEAPQFLLNNEPQNFACGSYRHF